MNITAEVNLGTFSSKEQADKIVDALEGETFFNFVVQYGNYANNYSVDVMTEYPDADQGRFEKMVMHLLARSI